MGSRGVGRVGCGGRAGLQRSQILAGGYPLGPLEDTGKIELIEKADRDGHFGNGQAAVLQQLAGLVDPVFGQVVDGALAHVAHKDAVEVAAGDPDALGHVVDRDIVRVIELDVLDGVQDVLAGRIGAAGPPLAALLHQGGDEEVEIPHHGRLVLDPQPAGAVDVLHRLEHLVEVLGVMDRPFLRKGQQGGQPVGADPVEAHPAVFPGLLRVGGISVQLAGRDKKEVAGGQLPGLAPGLKGAPARQHQMDQVMVPDAGAPGVAGGAALQPAVEDGQVHVVGKIVFERLFINLRHNGPPFRAEWGTPSVYHIRRRKFNKSTSESLSRTPKILFSAQENCKMPPHGLQ